MSDVAKSLRNDAVARFDAIDLAEQITARLHQEDLVLDGAEWSVREGLDFNEFVMADEESGQSFLVTIHLDIARHS